MNETDITVKNALSLGIGTLVSRLFGLGRDILFAYILGAGLIADIFLAAFRLPHFFRRLLYEGGLGMSFIPIFKQTQLHDGLEKAFTFGRTAIIELSFSMLCFVILCVYGADALAALLLPGYASSPEIISRTGQLLRLTLFYLPAGVAAALLFGMLIALGCYKVPAYSPAALNLGLLAAGLCALLIGASGMQAAVILCLGLLAGALLQVLAPLPALIASGYKLFGKLDAQATPSRAFLRAMPMSLFGSASYQMNVLLAMFLASFLGPGHISALYFAERLIELPMALVGVTLATASLPNFAKLSMEERQDLLSHEIGNILGVCFFLTLPAAVGLIVFALPIVYAIFGHGQFDVTGVSLTAVALVFYAPALPAVAGIRPLLGALNARGRTAPTVGAALISLGVMFILARLLMPSLGLAGIALSATLAAWLNFALLGLTLLRVRLTRFFPWQKLLIYSGLSLVMGGLCWLLLELLDYLLSGGMSVPLRLAVGIPTGLGLYFCMAFMVRSPELAYLRKAFGFKN